MCKWRTDGNSLVVLDAVEFRKIDQQHRKPLRHRACSEHLQESRQALALELECLDDSDREFWNFLHQLAQVISVERIDVRLLHRDPRPHVGARAEYLRRSDNVAWLPVGQRDLAADRGCMECTD